MVRMRKTGLVSILFVFSCLCYPQNDNNAIDFMDLGSSTTEQQMLDEQSKPEIKKLKMSMQVGTSYTFSSNGFGGPSFSISPQGNYALSERFHLLGGMGLQQGLYKMPFAFRDAEDQNNALLPMTRVYLYAGGNYLVNDKLSVSGTVYKQIMDVPNPNAPNKNAQINTQGMRVGFEYKLTPSIRIGAEIRVASPNSEFGYYHPGMYNNNLGNW